MKLRVVNVPISAVSFNSVVFVCVFDVVFVFCATVRGINFMFSFKTNKEKKIERATSS